MEAFADNSLDPAVRGFIYLHHNANNHGIILAHGAGSNSHSPLLIAISEAFGGAGFTVLCCDLAFRQARPYGPPRPGDAARDREGLKNAVAALRRRISGRVFLGGHSYGGRQATMLMADQPELAIGLLLLSYPLHPPRKPEQLRVQHFPELKTPAMFVHGTRDPFGSIEEMKAALKLISSPNLLVPIESAGHDLKTQGKSNPDIGENVLSQFRTFFKIED